jgi:hypothetical protein
MYVCQPPARVPKSSILARPRPGSSSLTRGNQGRWNFFLPLPHVHVPPDLS